MVCPDLGWTLVGSLRGWKVHLMSYTCTPSLKYPLQSVQDAEHDQVLEKMSNSVPRPCLTCAVRVPYQSFYGAFFLAAPL